MRRADKVGAADFGQYAIERPRVGRLHRRAAGCRNALDVAPAIDIECGVAVYADAGREPLPFGRQIRENCLRLTRDGKKSLERRPVALRPALWNT